MERLRLILGVLAIEDTNALRAAWSNGWLSSSLLITSILGNAKDGRPYVLNDEWRHTLSRERRLLDPWGSEYHISLSLPTASNKHPLLTIWSKGPDRKDQGGRGDDAALGPFEFQAVDYLSPAPFGPLEGPHQ